MQTSAAVLREHGGPLLVEAVELEPPRQDEVLVRIEAVGICRTDTEFANFFPVPVVLGHEGAGVVASVGSSVRSVVPGDRVLLTFSSCGHCRPCLRAAPSYCQDFDALNFAGHRPDGTSALSSGGEAIAGHFLGQSSFARHAVVGERSVVRVAPDTDPVLLAPLGCGFMTGAGAVLNELRPRVGDSVAIFGAGAVGLAAVAASAAAGCHPVVAVDRSSDRLALAARMGASATVLSGGGGAGGVEEDQVASAVLASAGGHLDLTLDTTGLATVVRTATEVLHTRGTCGVIGVGPDPEMVLDWRTMLNGRTVTGIISGSSVPAEFLPRLLDLHRRGRFPVDLLIERYPFEDIGRAFDASRRGEAVKAVLTF